MRNKNIMADLSCFTEFFEPLVLGEDQLLDEVYKLRYNVYCNEFGFEEKRASKRESDEFDEYSSFCIIRHKSSEDYVACIRLVKPESDDHLLPMEKYFPKVVEDNDFRPRNFSRKEVCEVSRVAIRSDYRKFSITDCSSESGSVWAFDGLSETELNCMRYISMGLYVSATALAIAQERYHGFLMMQKNLSRKLRLLGLHHHQIGLGVDYHGLRFPYYMDAMRIEDDLLNRFGHFYESIKNKIEEQINVDHCGLRNV